MSPPYTRKQMIEDISVLEDGRIAHDPDDGECRLWDPVAKRWNPIEEGTLTCGELMDGRFPNKAEIAELTAAGAIPAR